MSEFVNVPADFAMDYLGTNADATPEDMMNAYLAANPQATQTTETTTGTTATETTSTTTETATTETQATTETVTQETTQTPTFDWSKYGVTSEEEFSAKIQSYEDAAKKAAELEAKWKEIEPKISVLDMVENPFANEDIRKINAFAKGTGISDLRVVSEIVATSKEQLEANPIRTLAISQILTEPALAKFGIETMERMILERANINPEDMKEEGFQLPLHIQVDAVKALSIINEKRENLSTGDNYFVDLQNKAQEQKSLFENHMKTWETKLPTISSSLKGLTHEVDTKVEGVGKVSVSVAVSEAEVTAALEGLKSFGVFSNLSPDEKGVTALRQAVESNLRLSKMDEIIGEAVKAAEGKITERLTKEKHNLAPVTTRPAPAPTTQKVSPADEALDKILRGEQL